MRSRWAVGLLGAALAAGALAAEPQTVRLPPPQTDGGLPLMQALKARHSTREFAPQPLPPQLLSNLLWAAAGINRPDAGKRTAPSARNWQEIDVYAATADGVYRFDPRAHALERVTPRDLHALTGQQDYVPTAPLNLVYVANLDRMTGASTDDQALYSATDAAFIAQNVYLFCASEGLAVVVRGLIDRKAFAVALGLPASQRVILAQSVGYSNGER